MVHTIESVHLPYLSHINLVDDHSPVQRHPCTANPHLLSSIPDDIVVDYAVWPLAFLSLANTPTADAPTLLTSLSLALITGRNSQLNSIFFNQPSNPLKRNQAYSSSEVCTRFSSRRTMRLTLRWRRTQKGSRPGAPASSQSLQRRSRPSYSPIWPPTRFAQSPPRDPPHEDAMMASVPTLSSLAWLTVSATSRPL